MDAGLIENSPRSLIAPDYRSGSRPSIQVVLRTPLPATSNRPGPCLEREIGFVWRKTRCRRDLASLRRPNWVRSARNPSRVTAKPSPEGPKLGSFGAKAPRGQPRPGYAEGTRTTSEINLISTIAKNKQLHTILSGGVTTSSRVLGEISGLFVVGPARNSPACPHSRPPDFVPARRMPQVPRSASPSSLGVTLDRIALNFRGLMSQ
jgi:hypothetical protein